MELISLSIRVPAALAERIRADSAADHRSLNRQVVHLLERVLAEPTPARAARPPLDSAIDDAGGPGAESHPAWPPAPGC